MRDSHGDNGSAAVFFAPLLAVVLLLIIVGVGMTFLYLRQVAQRQLVAQEQALVQAELARAEAVRAIEVAKQRGAVAEQSIEDESALGTGSDIGTSGQDASVEKAVLAELEQLQANWNNGKVEEFMKAYWNSPELSFVTEDEVIRGWQDLSAEFQQNYSSDTAGELKLDQLTVRQLGPGAALVVGNLQHGTGSDVQSNEVTILLQRFNNQWFIVHQHVSRK